MSEVNTIKVVVIPFGGTSFPTTGHGVNYAHGPVPQLDTVHLDTAHGDELIDAAAQVDKYQQVLDRMENAALPPAPSRDLIRRIASDL